MNLEIFKNNGYEIRGFMVNDEPYFVGKDIAESLGYEKVSNAISRHVDNEDKMQFEDCPVSGQIQLSKNSLIINESGMYALIFGSKLPKAKEFKKWVTSEVLPSIRKTGSYTKSLTPMEQITATLEMANKEIAKERAKKEITQKILTTATTVFDNTHEDMLQDNIGMQELCQILTSRATDVVVGRTTLYSIMRSQKLVTMDGRKPTQYGNKYLDYRHGEHGYSIRIPEDRIGKLISAIIKHLLNNDELNEALGYPFHPELRE